MYITTIYSKMTFKQKKNLLNFIQSCFDKNYNFELESNTIIILDITNNIINGCICIYDNKYLIEKLTLHNVDQKKYKIIKNKHGCFIYNFCVNKNLRNQHIGYKLLGYTIEKMIKLNIEYLHTNAENDISQHLFFKYGFIHNDTCDGTYIMSKIL